MNTQQMKNRRVCRFLVRSVFKFSNLRRRVYVKPELAFVTDDYCQSFGEGRGCMYWNGKECTDAEKWNLERFNEFYYSTLRKLRRDGYEIEHL